MKLFEEFKLYESMWDDPSCNEAVAVSKETDQLCSVLLDGRQMFTGTKKECEDWVKSNGRFSNRLTIKDSATVNTVKSDTKTSAKQPINEDSTTESGCKGAECKNDLKEEVGYRVVLADYDTDDFDINVEFGMQDPDENEVVDYEYLLKPGQTKGDLVVWLSRDCGYTSIYVHDERPATDVDIKRLASDTFPVAGTKDEWQDYGSLDEALTESDDPYGYGPYKKFSDPDLEVGDYVLTTRPFSRGGRTYPARITSISSKWIEYEISGFGFTDKGTKARPGSASDSAIRKAAAHLGV